MSIRQFNRVTAVWPSGSPTSSALPVPFGAYAGGKVIISGAFTNSHIGLREAAFGAWYPVLDWQAGYTGVSIPSASGNAILLAPPAWFYVGQYDHTVKLWSHDGTGSGVPQGDVRTVVVDLKS